MAASVFSPTFIIGHIRIGTVESASCVNLGNNYPIGFKSQKKHLQGFGSVGGDHNRIEGARAVLNEAEHDDSFANGDEDVPGWVKELIAGSMKEHDAGSGAS